MQFRLGANSTYVNSWLVSLSAGLEYGMDSGVENEMEWNGKFIQLHK